MEIKGKYTTAVVHTDNIEQEAIDQINEIVNCRAFEGQTVHYMPDVHAGMHSTVGFTSTLGDYINPQHLGGDLGCTVSMLLLEREVPENKYAEFEHRLRKEIPMGSEINEYTVIDEKDFMRFLTNEFNKARQQWPEALGELPTQVTEKWILEQIKRLNMEPGMFYSSLLSVGGGNHGVEYGSDGEHFGVMVHCGSRNFGQKVAKYWTMIAQRGVQKKSSKDDKERIKELRAQFKEDWKRVHWKDKTGYDEALKKFIEEQTSDPNHIPGYLTGDDMNGYLCDLCFAQCYARYNHIAIHNAVKSILSKYDIPVKEEIFCTHNYVDFEERMMRKGAISAKSGQTILVPFNMRDGVAVCVGKGNPDWNYSCSHGAGRRMSRAQAKKRISLDEFKESMKDVYSTSVGKETLDESPQAYKDTEEIKSLITQTCDILYIMPARINLKATSSDGSNDD